MNKYSVFCTYIKFELFFSATAGPRKRKQKTGNEDESLSIEIAGVKRAIDFVEQEGSNPTKLSCEDENRY